MPYILKQQGCYRHQPLNLFLSRLEVHQKNRIKQPGGSVVQGRREVRFAAWFHRAARAFAPVPRERQDERALRLFPLHPHQVGFVLALILRKIRIFGENKVLRSF